MFSTAVVSKLSFSSTISTMIRPVSCHCLSFALHFGGHFETFNGLIAHDIIGFAGLFLAPDTFRKVIMQTLKYRLW